MTSPSTQSTPTAGLPDGAAQVLSAVRLHGCRSRVEIMRRTGLTRMVTAQRVQHLLDVGLLREEGFGPSSGGRRPKQLTFLPAGHLLVADVGWTSVDVAITDLAGRLLAHVAESTDVTDGPDVTLSQIEKLFGQLLADHQDIGPLWGVGIGIPAPVEFGTGRAVAPAGMPTWDDYPVRERLAERYDAPTWVDNDVNIMMLGEHREGAAKDNDNAVFIKLGTGIGIALVSEGRLHRGAQGCAGRLGNLLHLAMSLRQSDLPPPGDTAGQWTAAAVVQKAKEYAVDGTSPWLAKVVAQGETVTAQTVAQAAAHGDTACLGLLREVGAIVGTMLATVVSLLNPSVLVIGGGMSASGDFFTAAIREAVHGQAVPLATRDLRIVTARLGSRAGVVGAAAMALDQLFSAENLDATVTRGLQLSDHR
ncbi:ROK family transcriptional regulator [Actinopolymorpha sp. B17G11]|uniref:ROK family transcriptional regulator n=1 Tax=Actinopolymorpha sp. B17G11 TaxID=3160861 RepID=UPI0032E4FF4A